MKKIFIIVMAAAVAALAFAQEGPSLKLSGDVKTGIFYQDEQQDGKELDVKDLLVENHDGDPNGNRFRLNLDYDNGNNTGFRARMEWTKWSHEGTMDWSYAFGYGNFFNDTLAQMTVSAGKLGGSPWGTGGDMWKELEANGQGGMRVEWKPAWSEDWGRLNIGFVLNTFNSDMDQGTDNTQIKITLMEIIKESVLGVSYTHNWGMIRFAYRFDSEVDAAQDNKLLDDGGKGEDEFIYRVEEHLIRNYVPGLQLWALGHLYGISATNKEIQYFRNWFLAEYNPPEMFGLITPFTVQLSVGNDSAGTPGEGMTAEVFIKPSFYWHFFNKFITVGSSYRITFDYGDGGIQGPHPYYYMELEPKLQLNFPSSYIAFVYNFRQQYAHEHSALPGREPIIRKQWMNLRFCINF